MVQDPAAGGLSSESVPAASPPPLPSAAELAARVTELARRLAPLVRALPAVAAMAAAWAGGSSVDRLGTMPQASTMAPKTMYGAPRNSGLAPSATTDSFQNSLCSVR